MLTKPTGPLKNRSAMRTWGLMLSLTQLGPYRIWYWGVTFTMRDWLTICHNSAALKWIP